LSPHSFSLKIVDNSPGADVPLGVPATEAVAGALDVGPGATARAGRLKAKPGRFQIPKARIGKQVVRARDRAAEVINVRRGNVVETVIRERESRPIPALHALSDVHQDVVAEGVSAPAGARAHQIAGCALVVHPVGQEQVVIHARVGTEELHGSLGCGRARPIPANLADVRLRDAGIGVERDQDARTHHVVAPEDRRHLGIEDRVIRAVLAAIADHHVVFDDPHASPDVGRIENHHLLVVQRMEEVVVMNPRSRRVGVEEADAVAGRRVSGRILDGGVRDLELRGPTKDAVLADPVQVASQHAEGIWSLAAADVDAHEVPVAVVGHDTDQKKIRPFSRGGDQSRPHDAAVRVGRALGKFNVLDSMLTISLVVDGVGAARRLYGDLWPRAHAVGGVASDTRVRRCPDVPLARSDVVRVIAEQEVHVICGRGRRRTRL